MIKVKQFEFSMFGVNTYLIYDTDTKEAAVVDPAMDNEDEQKHFDEYVKTNGLKITQIINTHLHLDHCFGLEYVKDKYGVPAKAHIAEATLGNMMRMQYQMFGMTPKGNNVVIDVQLSEGDVINVGNGKIQVIHVPGHTPGGIALYIPDAKVLISGDSLFHGSIGRTDLPGGNHAQLLDSVSKKLLTLPDDTVVLPGHNDPTTIGFEKEHNPFVGKR